MIQRDCIECSRVFNDSEGRRRKCHKCRSMTATCGCGTRMHRSSKTCQSCRMQDPGRNPNWKGGVVYHKKGYLMVRLGKMYKYQHVLVMEEYLGRPLLAHENVHHKNGVRDDNRIENLELWSTYQPSGQRAKDKLKWAREIIALYEGLE